MLHFIKKKLYETNIELDIRNFQLRFKLVELYNGKCNNFTCNIFIPT